MQHFQEIFSELKREITSMHLVQNFGLIIWCCFLLIMLSFAADNENADVIKHCMNSTNSTSCSLTYEHVYKSLTKNENSFNISHALYPEGGKPSFLVRVNVYGPNKTHNSVPAQFIWSIHCLFSNVPALLLEMLSLGSIIVSSRTQELNIQIPAFCCNLSANIEKRKEMMQGFVTRALFEVSADFHTDTGTGVFSLQILLKTQMKSIGHTYIFFILAFVPFTFCNSAIWSRLRQLRDSKNATNSFSFLCVCVCASRKFMVPGGPCGDCG